MHGGARKIVFGVRGPEDGDDSCGSLFRDGAVCVANVGDTRSYFIRQKTIRRLTTDHVATSVPVKLGMLLERQAMASPKRSELTRSLGAEAFCQADFATQLLHHGDFVLQCTDGLHAFVLDEEMREIICRSHPYDACKELVALAQKRGSDDNVSLQLIEVRNWEQVAQTASSTLGDVTPSKKAVAAAAVASGASEVGPAGSSTTGSRSRTSWPEATWPPSSRRTTARPARPWRSRSP